MPRVAARTQPGPAAAMKHAEMKRPPPSGVLGGNGRGLVACERNARAEDPDEEQK